MANNKVKNRLIEDNMNDADLSFRALRKSNVNKEIIHIKNGVEVTDFLFGTRNYATRDLSNKPKAILLGLKMPKMEGLKVSWRINANELPKVIPAVVLTSSKEHPNIERAYALNTKSYILNPFRFNEFAKMVARLFFIDC